MDSEEAFHIPADWDSIAAIPEDQGYFRAFNKEF
jgi:hypothetical protein